MLLQQWLDTHPLGSDGRLPAERVLAADFGVSRAELRKALGAIEEEGRIVRHVGRGTFVVRRVGEPLSAEPSGSSEADQLFAARVSPRQILEAGLALEPGLARLAALNATGTQMDAIRAAGDALAGAASWSAYDEADRRFHRCIAHGTGNPVLIAQYETVAAIRRDSSGGASAIGAWNQSRVTRLSPSMPP